MRREHLLNSHDDLNALERDFAALYGNPSPESVLLMQNSYATLLSELQAARRKNAELERRLSA